MGSFQVTASPRSSGGWSRATCAVEDRLALLRMPSTRDIMGAGTHAGDIRPPGVTVREMSWLASLQVGRAGTAATLVGDCWGGGGTCRMRGGRCTVAAAVSGIRRAASTGWDRGCRHERRQACAPVVHDCSRLRALDCRIPRRPLVCGPIAYRFSTGSDIPRGVAGQRAAVVPPDGASDLPVRVVLPGLGQCFAS